jgi:chemotaxis protein methyltransferase CheR
VEREFDYTDADFEWVRKEIYQRVGISLNESKREMVYARVARRLRQLGMSDFGSYRKYLTNGPESELIEFANSLTTNVTAFFRENHHFEVLANEIVPELVKLKTSSKKIRVWSAGCSSGEEPYSIAITLMESLPEGWRGEIVATDLDTQVLDVGKKGIYPIDRLKNIPQSKLKKWFWKGKGANSNMARVVPELQKMIEFRQLNLISDWKMSEPFDLIFCRNVIIYFDKETQKGLFSKFSQSLRPQGWMFLGHSESLHGVSEEFRYLKQTIHRKLN